MEFVQLLKNKKKEEAVEFIRQQNIVISAVNREEFQKAMGCLVFSDWLEDFKNYEYFFSEDRWS
jgi:hypothetical protein